jgi:hypothetical protein
VLLDVSEEVIADVKLGDLNAVGVLQGNLLAFVEQGACFVVQNIENFLDSDTLFAAHGSINILSEHASVQLGYSAIDQRRQLAIEQAG